MSDENQTNETNGKRTISEELEVAGNQLVDRVKEIVQQGNVRRVVIKTADDRELLNTTLTVGTLAGGAFALLGGLPFALLGVIAATVARVKIEIIRELNDGDVLPDDGKRKIEISDDE
ncbi:MAG: DUF4342 domain-containing protein [Aggregatilineales bacterium]